tara:strand:+ start:436 stop:3927 length:3492 start_codon:yes stop_codon:yes gene_type:complete
MSNIINIRKTIRKFHLMNEEDVLNSWSSLSMIDIKTRLAIQERAIKLVNDIRDDDNPALLELFLAEYGLSTDEGVALMCLAEALMRIPDANTMDEIIEDKIAPSSWDLHRGNSNSLLVNASTWGLMLTGKVLDDQDRSGLTSNLRAMVKRLGEPVIRTAVKRAMKELGSQFVLGETIKEAIDRGIKQTEIGYTFSYDMLGEAALTEADAKKFYLAYETSINYLSNYSKSSSVRDNPGISIKLSALHPRYEVGQKIRVMQELVESTLSLTLLAKKANIGLNIDAEEADRLDLSLDIIEAVLSDERLTGWDGFGVVVQAYSKRALPMIDWLHAIAEKYDRKIMIRLVKGAYWDTEIKRAQVEGLSDFPVFTQKSATDCSYIYCAERLLMLNDRIYPQFATHNANSVAMILEMAEENTIFEFQRLHGMGETLHRITVMNENIRCRIYAPVGPHRDLLAYLVRRLLENGANSSFVNQIIDTSLSSEDIAADPLISIKSDFDKPQQIKKPKSLFGKRRCNSKGWDLHNESDIEQIIFAQTNFKNHQWNSHPMIAGIVTGREEITIKNPADRSDIVGFVTYANEDDVKTAIKYAKNWADCHQMERSRILNNCANILEKNFGQLFAILTREAGKTTADAIGELREAVDFLRYYALEAEKFADCTERGIFTCISPWNFPLAIFTGQIAAALSVGNGVLAKPAEATTLCAGIAVDFFHQAGVPKNVLQLLPGEGVSIGAAMVSHRHIDGICFTGSTPTALNINKSMAHHSPIGAPLIAETGGLNVMIVDSTALPEQAIKDIITSSFQSAGQRCSALRVLYLQHDIAAEFMAMLFGAMDELVVADPWSLSTDIGPVINDMAKIKITSHIAIAKKENRLLKQLRSPKKGSFVGPAVIEIDTINDISEEIFGPVLHVAKFDPSELDQIVEDINSSGYGLTFGLHTRIDDRAQKITANLNMGNMYVNRNQIGAIVGSQPFGGEGLSGTGPKAGGPNYLQKFITEKKYKNTKSDQCRPLKKEIIQSALNNLTPKIHRKLGSELMKGPTGESNLLSYFSIGTILCLGPTIEKAMLQAKIVKDNGCEPLIIVPGAKSSSALSGFVKRDDLSSLYGFDAVVAWSDEEDQRAIKIALANRVGPIIPLITQLNFSQCCRLERHLCVDTTAAGGNAALLASSS